MNLQRPNANDATRTANRSRNVSPMSGICTRCIDGCTGNCEVFKATFRGRELIYPMQLPGKEDLPFFNMKKLLLILFFGLFSMAGYCKFSDPDLFKLDEKSLNAEFAELNKLKNYVSLNQGITLTEILENNKNIINSTFVKIFKMPERNSYIISIVKQIEKFIFTISNSEGNDII